VFKLEMRDYKNRPIQKSGSITLLRWFCQLKRLKYSVGIFAFFDRLPILPLDKDVFWLRGVNLRA
jgi:hypothetical protein